MQAFYQHIVSQLLTASLHLQSCFSLSFLPFSCTQPLNCALPTLDSIYKNSITEVLSPFFLAFALLFFLLSFFSDYFIFPFSFLHPPPPKVLAISIISLSSWVIEENEDFKKF